MAFTEESEFEDSLVNVLISKGWHDGIIMYPTEADLLKNWADILYSNNNTIDRLNDCTLTDSEMQKILEQIKELRTPLKLNGFINGKTISLKRDNLNDKLHFGKEVSLKIYDRSEIAAGQSRYQIARQPKFKAKSSILNERRGDLMLLINGMPVIHIELKNSGIPVSQAYNQIEKYSDEGIFTGIFSLVQIFVAMEPDETVYFANPGPDGRFNKDFYFHWADFNNNPINDWKMVADRLLSIPMAHMMIGFYTVADDTDGILKVMRSYQYYAASGISEKVSKTDWTAKNNKGGYIWHTTGSGKTMTSFKSAQLIANSRDADKVIFLMDRIELGTQSLLEYRGFADENEDVQATENTGVLITKLKSDDPANTLIVTSIQKMSNIKADGDLKEKDIQSMNSKRIVFIVDECHRSTFGDMLTTIKDTFSSAIFFGFTGTPIQDENQKKLNTTATVFGDEIHRYSIADGIRDKNVLGFDPYKVLTYSDNDLRKAIGLEQSKASSVEDALADPIKAAIFNRIMRELKMYGYRDDSGKYIKGIEDYISTSQYQRIEHQNAVVDDIVENWLTLSQNSKYHAIFATNSIPEAIQYYRLFKEKAVSLKVTALFDPNIDNNGGVKFKEDGLVELITDYNARYGQDFSLQTHDKLKKDIALRMAHKKPYERIEKEKDQQIDLLIVVDQMLTGFDSKWVNTLYLDKVLRYENIIQAFSRTNRLAGPDKPFGTVKYYRYPHTMEQNIIKAVKLYSGDRPFGLFVERLDINLTKMNQIFEDISALFKNAGIDSFSKLPDDKTERGKFAKLFNSFNDHLEAAKIQDFKWNKLDYDFEKNEMKICIHVNINETIYLTLVQRYKELLGGGGDGGSEDVPYDINAHISEIETDDIDTEYMNSRFEKYCKLLVQPNVTAEEMQNVLDELHKSFASLSQEEQKYANIFLNDVQSGNIVMEADKTLRDYITEYEVNAKNDQIHKMAEAIGVDEEQLRNFMSSVVNENNINEFGRFDSLKATVNISKAQLYFQQKDGVNYSPAKIRIRVHQLLQKFILEGGFEI